jgi:hypothetical protein
LLDAAILHNAPCGGAAAAAVLKVTGTRYFVRSSVLVVHLLLSDKGSNEAFEARVKIGSK